MLIGTRCSTNSRTHSLDSYMRPHFDSNRAHLLDPRGYDRFPAWRIVLARSKSASFFFFFSPSRVLSSSVEQSLRFSPSVPSVVRCNLAKLILRVLEQYNWHNPDRSARTFIFAPCIVSFPSFPSHHHRSDANCFPRTTDTGIVSETNPDFRGPRPHTAHQNCRDQLQVLFPSRRNLIEDPRSRSYNSDVVE